MFRRNNKQQCSDGGGNKSPSPPTTATTTTFIEPSTSLSDDCSSTGSCESMSSTDEISHPSTSTTTTRNNSTSTTSLSATNHWKSRKSSSSSSKKYDKRGGGGIYIPYRIAIPFVVLGGCLMLSLPFYEQIMSLLFPSSSGFGNYFFRRHRSSIRNDLHTISHSLYHLRATQSHAAVTTNDGLQYECRWYLAESAIPHSGLGIFTGIPLHKDDMIGYPDICIFVSDGPSFWTHLRSHSFGRGSFYGQYEGKTNRAACEGLITTVNTVPDAMLNMEIVSPILPTNAGLHRAVSPGAGASTHHYGIHGKALNTITAGSEITVDYGDWDFAAEKKNVYEYKPTRDVPWLQQYGWCIDYIDIGISTLPDAGRGAFARIQLPKGIVVAPAPLQVFHDRSIFKTEISEQLYVNYCIQPANTKMLLYPYGQGVNLINHSSRQPNVELRWSMNKMHHGEYLDLSTNAEFWKIVSPGSLILEVVALRDIDQGEELLLNYGSSWDDAWNKHIVNWRPEINATQFVYPSEIDETLPVRTIREQVDQPYPTNLITMCLTGDFEREEHNHVEWSEPSDYSWAEGMVFCHILERTHDSTIGDDVYNVSLVFNSNDRKNLIFDSTIPLEDLYIDFNLPRRAIRFIEKPFQDDEHLPNAFRHPIELPIHLVPDIWKI